MFHVIVAVFAVFGALWALAIWLVGGFTFPLPGVTIQSHDPLRPLAVGAIAAVIYLIARGPLKLRRVTTPLAILLALCPAIAGIARNSWTAGGADQYAYVSQADLWLQRDLTVPIPLAATAPWPEALLTFMPHGFRPAVTGPALVPVTAPGLPLLMAGAKTIAGHCAMFLVTPLTGALLVWITFLIGRRIDSGALGLAAAWLVATSPAVLAMLVSPMSDVPAAAFWAVAIYFTLGHTPRSALFAGLAASAAILIRPNLAPLAVILVLWKFWSRLQQRRYGEAGLPRRSRDAAERWQSALGLLSRSSPARSPAVSSSRGSITRFTDRRSRQDTDRCLRCSRSHISFPMWSGTAAGSS